MRKEARESEMLNQVFNGLSSSDGVLNDAHETIAVAEQVQRRRREKLHTEWSDNVHGKILSRIHDVIGKMSINQIERRLRQGLQDYLDTSNSKGAAVFRDVIIEADYNPMKYANQNIKFHDGDIKNPCQLDQWKANLEAALV
jgi:hypothetical protein